MHTTNFTQKSRQLLENGGANYFAHNVHYLMQCRISTLSFLETHTNKRKGKCFNTKTHHKLYLKVMITFKGT